jgi:hypothetical protein
LLFAGAAALMPGALRAQSAHSVEDSAEPFGGPPEVKRQLASAVAQASAQLKFHRPFEAAQILAAASTLIEAAPATRWPWRALVDPLNGYALLSLGQNQQALDVLQRGWTPSSASSANRSSCLQRC